MATASSDPASARVALVIGAGDSTGGAVAKRFAREGYVACVTRRTADKLQPLVDDIRAAGGQAHGFASDARNEEDVVALVRTYDFPDQDRNLDGRFTHALVDNGDGLTVSDRVTGLMWQRGGTDIMSHRSMRREVERINRERFAGHDDWRLPSMAEALSLLEREKSAADQYLHPCFSREQPFVFVEATRSPGGYWFVDFKQGRAYWSSGTIPGGFGRLCRKEK